MQRLIWVMGLAACGRTAALPADAAVGRDAPVGSDAVVTTHLTAMPAVVDFGGTILGCASTVQVVMITNTGSASSGGLTTSVAGSGASTFSVTADGCTGQDLAAAASCTVSVQLTPTTPGAKTATLVVTGPGATVSVTMDGTVLTPAPLSISPSFVDFGVVAPGTTSAPATITVAQAAGCPASGTLAVTLGGGDPQQFAVATDSCSGTGLAGGATCTLGVTYTAKASGTSSAAVTVHATTGTSVSTALAGE